MQAKKERLTSGKKRLKSGGSLTWTPKDRHDKAMRLALLRLRWGSEPADPPLVGAPGGPRRPSRPLRPRPRRPTPTVRERPALAFGPHRLNER
jgi:hypothetical protein